MVCRLLLVLFGGMVPLSCLLSNPPDYDEPVSSVPVVYQMSPASQLREIVIDDSVSRTPFSVWLKDENTDDSLRYRWYLDFEPPIDPDVVPAVGDCNCVYSSQAISLGGGRHRLDYVLSDGDLDGGACHRLTLVVTDGEWEGEEDELGCPYVVGGANRIFLDFWLGASTESVPVDDVSFGECLTLSSRNPLLTRTPRVEP